MALASTLALSLSRVAGEQALLQSAENRHRRCIGCAADDQRHIARERHRRLVVRVARKFFNLRIEKIGGEIVVSR